MVGRQREFEDSLRKIRGPKVDISREETDIQVNTHFLLD